MCLQLEEGLLKGVMVDYMDDKQAHVFIHKDNKYSVTKPDGAVAEMSGKDILSAISGEGKDAGARAVSRKGR